MRAASESYRDATGVSVEWTARPLHSFEDTPLNELVREYDILAIDHPAIADAVASGSLLAFDDLVSPDDLSDRAQDSAGPSHASYRWDGRQWALGVDAACMVSAIRSDLIGASGMPTAWADVPAFAHSLGRERVLMAANPTHMFCTLLSLCEAVAPPGVRRPDGRPAWWAADGLATDVVSGALELLRELLDSCSLDSPLLDPIAVLDRTAEEDIAYVPIVFGYVTYSLGSASNRIVFTDPPGGASGQIGTLTGGVGLALSSHTSEPAASAGFALFATSRAVQNGVVLEAGGQPARASAWHSPAAPDFFGNTVATLESGFLRPRALGYPRFQSEAGIALHTHVTERSSTSRTVHELNHLWNTLVTI